MSLGRIGLRLSALMAIAGRTWAGDEVFDSEVGLIDQVVKGEIARAPFVVVYTDNSDMALEGRNLLANDGGVNLVFETAVQAYRKVEGDTPDQLDIAPETDSEMELMLDMIEHQILTALTDPDNEWAETFDGLFMITGRIRSLRAAESKTTRYAARQLSINVQPLREPVACGEPTGNWLKLIEALEASGKGLFVDYAGILRDAFNGKVRSSDPVNIKTGWKATAQRYGLSTGAAASLNITPYPGATDETVITEVNPEIAPE